MSLLKKSLALLLAVVLCLCLAACGGNDYPITGADWRTWGIVRDYGTITRYGEDTDVLVCVQVTDAAFYYDSEDQVLFDSVDYPLTLANKIDLSDNVWQAFQSIDFADLNSDGNSDVTMKFKIGWSELVSVWFWDTESGQFVFQPEESQLGKDDDNDVVDWRTWGIVCDSGTFTRGGKDTKVLVCVYEEEADFYYDSKEKVMFGSVNYPLTLVTAWDKLRGTDFADLNGDGNSDVTLMFDDQGNEIVMVWFWDTESKQFVFQPEESQLAVPVLRGGALPFPKMKTLQSENREDGTYYYADATEDEQIMVVNTVMQSHCVYDVQTLEDYLGACALTLGGAITYHLQTVEENDAYSEKMGHPVYIVTYTAGENEDAREWTVFTTDDGSYTYIYGICALPDAADDVKSVYQDIFAGLYLSDGE